MLKAVFFDAAGTLIYLPRPVGEHYAEVAERFGATLEPEKLDRAFKQAWAGAPARPSSTGGREDDDKGWWRDLVYGVLARTFSARQVQNFDQAAYFEAVYDHFALPGVWRAFDDVRPALAALRSKGLAIGLISNFDRRLYAILDSLDLRGFFDAVVISSEIGADKPDPFIFQAALKRLNVRASEAMHVGDDLKKDGGAGTVGLRVFQLDRPTRSLDRLLTILDEDRSE